MSPASKRQGDEVGRVVEELRRMAKRMRVEMMRNSGPFGFDAGIRAGLLDAADILRERANKLARLDGRGRGKR